MSSIDSKVSDCETIISYIFVDKMRAATALNTDGLRTWKESAVDKNDKLAILGDAAAAGHLCRHWLETGCDKAAWDSIRQGVLSNANLATVGFKHGLNNCVLLAGGTQKVSAKTMATTVEAILGAVLLDGGAIILEQVMVNLGLTHVLLDQVFFIEASDNPRAGDPMFLCIIKLHFSREWSRYNRSDQNDYVKTIPPRKGVG